MQREPGGVDLRIEQLVAQGDECRDRFLALEEAHDSEWKARFLALEQAHDSEWKAHLAYLRDLQRVARGTLARAALPSGALAPRADGDPERGRRAPR